MKKILFLTVIGAGISFCVAAQTGSTVKGKSGGSASAGNHKVEAQGHKGGSAKVDKSGVNIKGKNGGGLELGKKK